MKTKGKIIRLFLEERKPKTIREIALALQVDYKLTHTAVRRLISEQVLLAQTVGKSSLCSLNESYYGVELYHAENERKEDVLKNGNLRQVHKELLSKISTSFFVLLLFGSYAKGTFTKTSDIDLMFISNERNFEEKISTILSLLPLKTHLLVFTEEEFIRMKNALKSNVIQEAMQHYILWYGIEAYYNLKNR